MRKLFIIIVTLMALTMGLAGQASSAPYKYQYNSYHNGTYGNHALHWADTSRPGTVDVHLFGGARDFLWASAAASVATSFNSITTVKMGSASEQSSTCNPGADLTNIYAFKHSVCGLNRNTQNYSCNGGTAWLGCAWTYGSYNTLGQVTPHMAYNKVDIMTDNAVYSDGSTAWNWNGGSSGNYRRIMAFCHEVGGHGYGMDHTINYPAQNNDSSAGADPGHDSCLRAIMWDESGYTRTSSTLGSTVAGQIQSLHNHNDNYTEYAGIGGGAMSPKAAKRLRTVSVLKLKRGEGLINGKPVLIAPLGVNVAVLPKTHSYVYPLPPEQLTSSRPLLQSFSPTARSHVGPPQYTGYSCAGTPLMTRAPIDSGHAYVCYAYNGGRYWFIEHNG